MAIPLPVKQMSYDVVQEGERVGLVEYDQSLRRWVVRSVHLPELVMDGKTFKTSAEAQLYAKRVRFPSATEAYYGHCDRVYAERRQRVSREFGSLLATSLSNLSQEKDGARQDAEELLALIEDFALDGPNWRQVESLSFILCQSYPRKPDGIPDWTPNHAKNEET